MGDFNEFVEVEPKPKKNGWAIAAMILGIVAICICFCTCNFTYFIALAAIVFGIIALAVSKDSKGMAITGIVLGGVSLIIVVILEFVFGFLSMGLTLFI